MDVEHISFSSSGGAGLVAKVLSETQSSLGTRARLTVLTDTNLRAEPLRMPLQTLAAVIDNYLIGNTSTATIGSFTRRRLNGDSNGFTSLDTTLHLHWVDGVINRSSIGKMVQVGRPIVWTLHDMSPFTAFCHHSFDCTQFEGNCGNCPQVRPGFRKKVSLEFASNRSAFDFPNDNFCVVAPTEWMAQRARNSSTFRNQRVEVVSNPIARVFFQYQDRVKAREILGISQEQIVGIAIASDLSDKNKSIEIVVAGFFSGIAKSGRKGKLLVVGANGKSFASNNRDVIDLGTLDHAGIAASAIAADVNISMSKAESSGLTLREMGALGIPSIALAGSGMDSLIENGKNGFLVEDLESLCTAVFTLASNEGLRKAFGTSAKDSAQIEASPVSVARSYLSIYESLV
jgi:glycosyltransferase involved in cell wall biosynthesis